jgi:hypothetical protein
MQLQKLWRTVGTDNTQSLENQAKEGLTSSAKWIFVLRGEQVVPTIDELQLHRPLIFDPIFYALPSVTGSTTMVRITAYSKAYDLFQLRECPTAFYAMSLNINDGEYVLNVPTNQQILNFLVANNVLYDRPFWQWYMLQFHQLVLEATDKYWVHFFDDQMTVVSFSHRQCMRLTETGYEIIAAQAEPQEQAEPQDLDQEAADGNETDDSMPDLVSRSLEQLDDDVLLDDETVLPTAAEDEPEALNESSASLGSVESTESLGSSESAGSSESSSSSEATGEYDLVYVDLIDKKNL